MGEFINGTYLRPAANDAEVVERGILLQRYVNLRADIEQHFRDAAYWNRINPTEEPIDPDPDGRLTRLAAELDAFITAQQVKQ